MPNLLSAPPRRPAPRATPTAAAGLAALLLALLAAAWPAVASGPEGDFDQWYIIEMDGQHAGSMHSTQTTAGDRITTASTMRIEIRRGRTVIPVSVATEFVETLDGKPISMRTTQAMGAAPTTMMYTFGPEEVALVTTQEGHEPVATTLPHPEGAWLTPAAARTYTQKRLAADAKEIVVRTIDPTSRLQPIVHTRRVLERTTIETMGKSVPAYKTSVTTSLLPGMESVEYVDERGVSIRSATNLGGIAMNIIAAEREAAAAAADPPELMERTFVQPDRPIRGARETRRAVFLLKLPDGGETLASIPATAVQRVEPAGADAVRLTVDMDAPAPAEAADVENPVYLASSAMLNTADEAVRELVAKATAGVRGGPAERAEAMRRFVFRYINAKNLGVGFASASEVARTREGDCTEHAALLAAMLRIDGIPSRAASGLIYADAFAGARNIFGYHMWTQALLEVDGNPTWVDLDATLPPRTPFDATHIALAVSPLSDDDATNAMVNLVPMLGRLSITVESTSRGARPARSPAAPAPAESGR